MNVKYQVLFMAEILHDYYTTGRCADLSITPSKETLGVMRGFNLLHKVVGNKLVVVIRTDDAGVPLVPFNIPRKLTFYLQQENPHFYNFTNLGYQPSDVNRYYFTNLNENKIGSTLYLNKKVALYDATATYAVGSLAANGSDEVYEAIRPSDSGTPHGLGENTYWELKGTLQYITNDDLIEITPTLYNFTAPADTSFTINVYGFNTATGVYDAPAMDTLVLNYGVTQTSVPVKMEDIAPGKYRIDVNGTSRFVYVDNTAAYSKVFGIIEIFNHLPAASDFALVDGGGLSKHPTFSLRFANRLVLWKYLARTSDITAVKDNLAAYSFASQPGNQFVSVKPLPFKEKPYTSLYMESASLGNITQLANPPNDRLNIATQNGATYYCAEQYLNY